MTSTFTSIKNDPAWRWAIGVFVAGRLVLSLWAMVILQLNPLIVSQQMLYGTPVVAVFDPRANARGVFSPVIDGRVYHFRPNGTLLVDRETGSSWTLAGQATSGPLTGQALKATSYGPENVFPYQGVDASNNVLLATWQRFDTNWFLAIAARGYSANDGSTAYFPLYPILIRVVGFALLGNNLLAALVVSNLALIAALYLLYWMADELMGPRAAARTLVYFALFPTAFFLFAAYSESLFLFFSLAALREGMQARWNRAGLLGAGAALTRLQGIALLLPLALLWWQWYKDTQADSGRAGKRILFIPANVFQGGALLAIPAATAAFFLFSSVSTGSKPFVTTIEAQWQAQFTMPWNTLISAIGYMFTVRPGLIDILNLAATVGFGIMLLFVWSSRMPRWLAFYAIGMYIMPLFRMSATQPLVSSLRYVLVLFPVFMVWGKWGQNPWVQRLIVYGSFSLGLYLSAQFFLWGWVG